MPGAGPDAPTSRSSCGRESSPNVESPAGVGTLGRASIRRVRCVRHRHHCDFCFIYTAKACDEPVPESYDYRRRSLYGNSPRPRLTEADLERVLRRVLSAQLQHHAPTEVLSAMLRNRRGRPPAMAGSLLSRVTVPVNRRVPGRQRRAVLDDTMVVVLAAIPSCRLCAWCRSACRAYTGGALAPPPCLRRPSARHVHECRRFGAVLAPLVTPPTSTPAGRPALPPADR